MVMDGGSTDDLYASQNYVHTVNYSENENDFQTLKLDETLFENPSSRCRSEAQLTDVVFSNTAGLQAKAKKLDDLSAEKVLEFYDLHTPRNSPRKNRVSYSTGDLASVPSPSFSAGNLSKQTESPLAGQSKEQTVIVDIEQIDSTVENVEQTDDTLDGKQPAASNGNADQIESIPKSPMETASLQEDNGSCTSKDSLRETLTGTPDSGIVSQGSDQSVKPDNTSDGSTVTDSKSDTSSTNSSAVTPPNSIADVETPVTPTPVANNDTTSWETVADRKKRYLQTIEHATASRKSSTEDNQPSNNNTSSSFTPVEEDSDCDSEGLTTTLSSSQPMLNLSSLEEPKMSRNEEEDSSSDSDMEEMQSPLVLTKPSPHDTDTQTRYTDLHLSDSSDEDCEMVKPSEVVVHRSPVKAGSQEALQHRASHPPLQRTLKHEQIGSGVVQHTTKKRRHKPSLKSILEEDDGTHRTL